MIQATLISLWWLGLFMNEAFYNAFQYPGIGSMAFNSFLLPDLIIIALLSILRSYRQINGLDYIILGGFGFATLYCLNASILTNGGLLSTAIMIFGLLYNLFLIYENQLFRVSNTSNNFLNAIKTIIQIVCVWTVTLYIIPIFLIESFGEDVVVGAKFRTIGFILFLLFSLIGIYSAYYIVKVGKGTPLPLDQTQTLVIEGPYKYVRNPMAIAGIGQGISISIIFLSFHVLIYSLLGAVLWHFVVRPIEEKNMTERFGYLYIAYKSQVKCWIPKIIV